MPTLIVAIVDPDFESGSRDPIESGSATRLVPGAEYVGGGGGSCQTIYHIIRSQLQVGMSEIRLG
jgi:hypothetical protein